MFFSLQCSRTCHSQRRSKPWYSLSAQRLPKACSDILQVCRDICIHFWLARFLTRNRSRQLRNAKNKFLSRILKFVLAFKISKKQCLIRSFIVNLRCRVTEKSHKREEEMETTWHNHRNYLCDRPKTNTFVETVWQCSLGWRNDEDFLSKLENWKMN